MILTELEFETLVGDEVFVLSVVFATLGHKVVEIVARSLYIGVVVVSLFVRPVANV